MVSSLVLRRACPTCSLRRSATSSPASLLLRTRVRAVAIHHKARGLSEDPFEYVLRGYAASFTVGCAEARGTLSGACSVRLRVEQSHGVAAGGFFVAVLVLAFCGILSACNRFFVLRSTVTQPSIRLSHIVRFKMLRRL